MKSNWFLQLVTVLTILWLAGCGGGGGSVSTYDFGYIPGSGEVFMFPSPPVVPPPANPSGSSPMVTIYKITQVSGGAQDYTNAYYTTTSQVVYGTVSNVDLSTVQLVVFAETNIYYDQPLTGCIVHINPNGTWVCPSHAGSIHVLLVQSGYNVSFTYVSLPQVDGIQVLAAI